MPISKPTAEDEGMTAEELHEAWCADTPECRRWDASDGRHRAYYKDKAATLTTKLAPEIGEANVKLAVLTVLDEMG